MRQPDRPRLLADLALLAAALLGGALFFSSLGSLWPLARMNVNVPRAALEARARKALRAAGLSAQGYEAATELTVDDEVLDYLQRRLGQARAQALIARGLPIFQYEVHFKRRGEADRMWVDLPSGTGVTGWGRTVQEDEPGASIPRRRARHVARQAIAPWLAARGGGGWREQGDYEQARPHRRDHYFVFERYLSQKPPLRERLVVTVSGRRVTAVDHTLVVPEAARREARRRQAPIVALQMVGFLLAGVAGLGAFAVFLTRLRAGTARLGPAARWVAVIGVCFVVTQALRPARLLLAWDPLWPRWIADLQTLGTAAGAGAWILLVLFVVIAAGDALDREAAAPAGTDPAGEPRFGVAAPLAARRGEALWAAARGRLTDAAVGLASLRGFLVGLVCGGVMAASVLAVEHFAGGWSPIQPQGFFFYALNSRAPALATLLYFLMVALVEELAYRFFAGTWLLQLTGSRLAAIVLPAILYGTTHTGLSFVPPAEPFWGRALVFTLVGCVWGWAFLRYDALTVVLSHFSADLFIFNWPRLGSGDPILVAKGIATLAVPLVPALLWLAFGRLRRRRAAQ